MKIASYLHLDTMTLMQVLYIEESLSSKGFVKSNCCRSPIFFNRENFPLFFCKGNVVILGNTYTSSNIQYLLITMPAAIDHFVSQFYLVYLYHMLK
jgi:hypothetical protein